VNRDLLFVSGAFFETEIPKDKLFLLKYYTTPVQLTWFRYFIAFGDSKCFSAHTGYPMTDRYNRRMRRRYLHLVELEKDARLKMDFDKLWEVTSGGVMIDKII
jgi:hypothetical protein